MQIFEPAFNFIRDFGADLKVWMKFTIIMIVLLFAMLFVFEIDVNKALSNLLDKETVEMSIQPEKVGEVENILSRTVNNCGAKGSYVFAYLPIYAIKSSTLLQIYELSGVDYLSYEHYTNVPITIDGEWFLKMKSNDMYHRVTQPDGIYSGMYKRGVREFYAYPVIGKDGIIYGNLMVAFDAAPELERGHIREYLRSGVDSIVKLLEL
jgi:hypothetical protein